MAHGIRLEHSGGAPLRSPSPGCRPPSQAGGRLDDDWDEVVRAVIPLDPEFERAGERRAANPNASGLLRQELVHVRGHALVSLGPPQDKDSCGWDASRARHVLDRGLQRLQVSQGRRAFEPLYEYREARGPDVQEAPQGRGRLTHVRIERVREVALAREQRRRRDRAGNRHDAAKVVARVPQIREDSMDSVLSLRDVDDRIRRTDTLNHAMAQREVIEERPQVPHQLINNYLHGILKEGTRAAWKGIFGNPNEDAYALLILIPIAAGIASISRWHVRVALWGMIGVYLLAIFLTFSRGGLLGLFAVLGLMGWKQKSFAIRAGMIAVLVGGIVVGGMFWTRKDGFKDLKEDTTVRQRFATYEAGALMFEANPLLGVGPGCSLVAYPLYVPKDAHCGCQDQLVIHNSFLQTLSEVGFLGFIPFMVLLGAALYHARQLQKGSLSIEGAAFE